MSCRCHAGDLYRGLTVCPQCGHKSYDPGVGCERRRCGYTIWPPPPGVVGMGAPAVQSSTATGPPEDYDG